MPYTNFTTQEQQVFDLALDLARNDYAAHIDGEKVSKKDLENYLRKTIQEDILKGKTLYQAFRRNNVVMFESIIELLDLL